MKRIALASLLWVGVVCWAAQAELPLRVEGKTETVVTDLPFLVHAPTTADLYFWTVPTGVEYQEKGPSLLVTKCPVGRHTFRLKTIAVRWEDKKLVTENGQLTLVMGKIPDPEPDPEPEPGPEPLSPWEKSLAAAVKADGGNVEHVKALQALYVQAQEVAQDLKIKTAGDLYRILKDASNNLLPASALPSTRKLIAAELVDNLPTDAGTVLTQDHRAAAVLTFRKVAQGLEKIQ